VSWQEIAVAVIVLGALLFLALKIFPRLRPRFLRRPRPLEKPDVKSSDLVKDKRE